VGLMLAWSQISAAGGGQAARATGAWRMATVAAIAGVVGMVPQGLVLLTSVNFATASLRLARRRVLVQELPAVEVLARVDTLCLDKTGTITTGRIRLERVEGPGGAGSGSFGRGIADRRRRGPGSTCRGTGNRFVILVGQGCC